MLRGDQRIVLLQHGGLDSLTGKTGLAMLRYRSGPVVAVIDPDHAGEDLVAITGIARDVPVVADLAANPDPSEAMPCLFSISSLYNLGSIFIT